MKVKIIIYVLVAWMSFWIGCSKDSTQTEHAPKEDTAEQKAVVTLANIQFTKEEEAYIRQIKEKGRLVIATREKLTIYTPLPDGSAEGIHYNLAKSFADFLGIELKIMDVMFKDYFSIDGKTPEKVFTDPTYSYTPDLIKEVDVYADTLTILPWREKLLRFIEIAPTRIMLITRKGDEINAIQELDGKKVATVFETSYYTKLREIEKDYDISLEFSLVEDSELIFDYVAEGKADFSARDANLTILHLKNYKNLNVSMPISGIQIIGWAVGKDNEILESILRKYIEYAKTSGLIDQYWREVYGISMEEYHHLIEYDKK